MKIFKNFKELFNNLDKTDLKIMKNGIKFCLVLLLFSVLLLSIYLSSVHTIFLYDLGLSLFKLSTYFAVEFIVCGIVTDTIKKQIE